MGRVQALTTELQSWEDGNVGMFQWSHGPPSLTFVYGLNPLTLFVYLSM